MGGVILIALAVLGLIGIACSFRWRRRRERLALQRGNRRPIPLVAIPYTAAGAPARSIARPARPSRATESAFAPVVVETESVATEMLVHPIEPITEMRGDEAAADGTDFPVPRAVGADDLRFAPPGFVRSHRPAASGPLPPRRGRSLPRDAGVPPARQRPPADVEVPIDGTLQFLPGRLEVIQGTEMGHEIRFVRDYRAERTEITFGRSDGPPYRHVKLTQPTVSRTHARVIVDGSTWLLANLSTTNPVTVNGQPLAGVDSTVVLQDGDRIEMGEVAFRFHGQ